MTNTTIENLADDVLVATNEGTYGPEEACRKIGSGDPVHSIRRIYQRLNGSTYATGPTDFPGYMRQISHLSLSARQEGIAAEKIRVREKAKADFADTNYREKLSEGWDGYCFIGAEAGKAKLVSMGS